jgi:peptidyl-prolyl cis-trans isomerase D
MMNLTQGVVGKAVLGGIVVLIIFAFALSFRTGSGSPTSSLTTECVVELGSECLDAKDYFAAYGLLVGRGVEPKAARALGLKKRALDGLAERELLYAEAKRLGLGVSEDVIDQELMAGRSRVSLPAADMEILAFQLGLCLPLDRGYGCQPGTPVGVRQLRVRRTASEAFDLKVYERDIRLMANRGPKEFRATLERELIAERLRDLVRSRVRVSEPEARMKFERGRSKAVVRTVTIESTWFGKYTVDTSPSAVTTWASTHALEVDEAWKAQKGIVAGCPLVREITVPFSPMAAEAEKVPLRERAQALRDRVMKGEAFEAVARETSAGPAAAFGGLVGCLNESFGPGADVLSAAAAKLSPGGVSEVIETPLGFHVLKVEGKIEENEVEVRGKEQLARLLYLTAAQKDAARAFATEVIKQTKAGAKLEDVTRALTDELARRNEKPAAPAKEGQSPTLPALIAPDRPRFEISPPFTISGNPLPDVQALEPLAARAFELKEPDSVDERPIETGTGLVVLQLKEKTPASKEDFEKEKWALTRAMTDQKANDALVRYVLDLRSKAGSKLKVDARYGEESKNEETQ